MACLAALLRTPLCAQINTNPTFPEAVGLNIHFTDPKPGEMKMLAATGVGWVRMDFAWDWTEVAPGKYDFSRFDRLMAALQPYSIRPVFILDYTHKLYDSGNSPHSAEAQAAFASWAVAAASHFQGKGIIWEMYNEPNGPFWRPRANVQDYISLATKVGQAIRKATPGETLIGPGVSGVDFLFLEACFKSGLLNYWSGVSVHPYRDVPPESGSGDFGRLRQAIERNAPGKRIPVVVSEWGYPYAKSMDANTQAKILARTWLFNRAAGIPLSIWYNWFDPTSNDPKNLVTGPYNASHDPVYQPKPAYFAAQTLTSFLKGYRFSKRLAMSGLTGPNDYVLLFSNGNDVRVAAWTPLPNPHTIVIPASPGRFRVTNNMGQGGSPLTATAQGLTITVTDSPQYLQPEEPNQRLRAAANDSP
jgi:hypothetical protein